MTSTISSVSILLMPDIQKIRQMAPYFAIGALFSLCLYLNVNDQTLKHQNRDLSDQSKALENSLKEAQEKAEALREKSNQSQREKNSIEAELSALKAEYESFKIEYQKMETQWKSASEEKIYLEEMLLNKTKAIEILKKNPLRSTSGSPAPEQEELVKQIREKDEEIKKLDEQNKVLADKLDRLYKTTQSKIGEINAAKTALEETVSSARAKIDEEWNLVNLGSISMNQDPRKASKKEGRILALNNEHGFVVVNLGKTDDLINETALQIRKNDEIIATLSILEIRDDMSACNIKSLKDGMKIQVNDPVFIQ